MEHGLILLIEAILAIDRRMQKPLRGVVHDLPRLRAEPATYFADDEVIIGPRRPYAVASVLGFILAIAVLVGFVLSAMDNPARRVDASDLLLTGLAVLMTFAASTALFLGWLRGGSAVLRREGVTLIYRGRTVFCPWSLFHTPGVPYQPDHKRVILPVNSHSPIVLANGDDSVDAQSFGEIKTKQIQACADGQAALSDLYEVRLPELGELLLQLGRMLGEKPVGLLNRGTSSEPVMMVPLATVEAGDWLRVRLTRLPFPPICTSCGAFTREAIPHALDATHGVQVVVPLCRVCQDDRTRRRRRALWIGLGIGALPGLVWVLATAPFLHGLDVCLGFGLLLPIGLVFGLVGGLVARDRASPVRFKDYSASAGTVALWLRPSAGRVAFRRALGIADPSEVADMN